jgi:hypothetical protein
MQRQRWRRFSSSVEWNGRVEEEEEEVVEKGNSCSRSGRRGRWACVRDQSLVEASSARRRRMLRCNFWRKAVDVSEGQERRWRRESGSEQAAQLSGCRLSGAVGDSTQWKWMELVATWRKVL